jgi:tight adherence protein C
VDPECGALTAVALLFFIGVVLLGLAVALILRAVLQPRLRIAAQVLQLGAYGFGRRSEAAASRSIPWTATLAERVGSFLAAHVRTRAFAPPTRRELLAAGVYRLTPEALQGYRVFAAVGATAAVAALVIGSGSVSLLRVVLIIGVAAIAWWLPLVMLRSRGERRLDRVDRDLPELIDAMVVTIEVGLSFASSLQLVAGRFKGPLGNELRLTLQEQKMGLSTEGALRNLLDRCETPSMRGFATAVQQADSLGVSVGQMLRNVAVDARRRRQAKARERAQKAPVKMLFPMVLLIFPAMLLVLLYPTVQNIMHALHGG